MWFFQRFVLLLWIFKGQAFVPFCRGVVYIGGGGGIYKYLYNTYNCINIGQWTKVFHFFIISTTGKP